MPPRNRCVNREILLGDEIRYPGAFGASIGKVARGVSRNFRLLTFEQTSAGAAVEGRKEGRKGLESAV